MEDMHKHTTHPDLVKRLKRVLIHDHIDHCLSHDEDSVLTEMKALTKLL